MKRALAAAGCSNVMWAMWTWDLIDYGDDGVRSPSSPAAHAQRFSGKREHRVVPGVGHNMPQEVPSVFASAILELMQR